MSGHSKWATIHRKKGLIDAERGKVFQKLAKEIYIAARGTNGDVDSNPSLRAVVEKAKSNNMPKDNIQKAIDKAIGAAGDVNFESIRYEGYYLLAYYYFLLFLQQLLKMHYYQYHH